MSIHSSLKVFVSTIAAALALHKARGTTWATPKPWYPPPPEMRSYLRTLGGYFVARSMLALFFYQSSFLQLDVAAIPGGCEIDEINDRPLPQTQVRPTDTYFKRTVLRFFTDAQRGVKGYQFKGIKHDDTRVRLHFGHYHCPYIWMDVLERDGLSPFTLRAREVAERMKRDPADNGACYEMVSDLINNPPSTYPTLQQDNYWLHEFFAFLRKAIVVVT
ncbi:hypothetical protein FOZ61_006552 [Perkinsus olseni]|uniref:Uncharacterized protein n=1 Tax=Perkinsus olseni TaxID=32597 RepID=A0A7J6LDB1_PEROL|nr:hypothetical protein FOL46_008858 [Perkinsus olseni]KAF4656980.1 hypothetical protein FOZ61_006552 [Perkinsus olseni]